MNVPDQILSWLFAGLGLIFSHRFVAPLVLMPLMLGAAGLIWFRAARTARPFLEATTARISALKAALGSDGEPTAERASFAEAIGTVTAAMNRENPGAIALVRAWQEFHECIVDETETPNRMSARVITMSGHDSLLTCDNPLVMTALGQPQALVVLPINPRKMLVMSNDEARIDFFSNQHNWPQIIRTNNINMSRQADTYVYGLCKDHVALVSEYMAVSLKNPAQPPSSAQRSAAE